MRRVKMEAILASVWLLLQMTTAYSVIGHIPSNYQFKIRERRSVTYAPTQLTCDKAVINDLVKSTKETCSQIKTVDKHIRTVNSRSQITVPSFSDRHGFRDILNQYNTDLKTAQNNCHPWRNGDSIVDSLKNMVVATQGFETKFRDELEINKARVNNLVKNHEDIRKVEAKISGLEEDIRKAREVISLVSVPEVKMQLEHDIKTKEEEINTIMREHELIQGRRELAELVKYFEFVKNISADVEWKAENARTKISNFRQNIIKDSSAFKRHRNIAQGGIRRIEEERRNNNNELASNMNNINGLRSKITEKNNQIASLNKTIAHSQNQLMNTHHRINEIKQKIRRRKEISKWARFMSIFALLVFHPIYEDAKAKEIQLSNSLRDSINAHTKTRQNLINDIIQRTRSIETYRGRIRTLQNKARQLQQELQHFIQLHTNLHSIENEVNVILRPIASAINGLTGIKDSFDNIKMDIVDTIHRAERAKSEAEVKNMVYFSYYQIDELKCKWDNARNKILSVGQCS